MYQSDKVRMVVFGYDIEKFTVSDQHDQICFNEHWSCYQLHIIYIYINEFCSYLPILIMHIQNRYAIQE